MAFVVRDQDFVLQGAVFGRLVCIQLRRCDTVRWATEGAFDV